MSLVPTQAAEMGRGRAVVVLDSRGDLIRTVANLKVFEPGERMHDPVSLNLFDARIERLSGLCCPRTSSGSTNSAQQSLSEADWSVQRALSQRDGSSDPSLIPKRWRHNIALQSGI